MLDFKALLVILNSLTNEIFGCVCVYVVICKMYSRVWQLVFAFGCYIELNIIIRCETMAFLQYSCNSFHTEYAAVCILKVPAKSTTMINACVNQIPVCLQIFKQQQMYLIHIYTYIQFVPLMRLNTMALYLSLHRIQCIPKCFHFIQFIGCLLLHIAFVLFTEQDNKKQTI